MRVIEHCELVRHNADLNVVDAHGDGPLDLAEMNEQWGGGRRVRKRKGNGFAACLRVLHVGV